MPTIAEILGAEKKRPVLKSNDHIALVDEDRAMEVSRHHHGNRAHIFVGNPVWVTPKGLTLKG